jgi:nuclear pore complex protein Nup160
LSWGHASGKLTKIEELRDQARQHPSENATAFSHESLAPRIDGDKMESPTPFYAYKETRLDLDPATQGSTVAIRLPPHGASTIPSRTAQKRSYIAEIPIAEDEIAFRQSHLATATTIYHRSHHKSPKSFLWRVLEDGKVLSIRVVDVSRQSNSVDANLTLRLAFPNPILPGCITLSDSKDHDILSIFVITNTKHLYTLSLRPDFFRRPSSTEDNVDDWCKSYASSAFIFKYPHRVAALGADQLLISAQDGSLVKLDRNSGGDGKKSPLLNIYMQMLMNRRFYLERNTPQ